MLVFVEAALPVTGGEIPARAFQPFSVQCGFTATRPLFYLNKLFMLLCFHPSRSGCIFATQLNYYGRTAKCKPQSAQY